MGILFSLLLIVLGIIGAETVIGEKLPPSKSPIAKITQYKEIIGTIGIIVGLISLIEWVVVIMRPAATPFYVVFTLITVLLTLSLGLIFGLSFVRQNLPNPTMVPAQIEELRLKLVPYQQALGLGAIVFGVLYLLLNL